MKCFMHDVRLIDQLCDVCGTVEDEELTFNYGYQKTNKPASIFMCRCGAANCQFTLL